GITPPISKTMKERMAKSFVTRYQRANPRILFPLLAVLLIMLVVPYLAVKYMMFGEEQAKMKRDTAKSAGPSASSRSRDPCLSAVEDAADDYVRSRSMFPSSV